MKKVFALLALAATTGSIGAFAFDSTAQRARIPFDFKVGKKQLPAGEYRLIADGHILRVQSVDGKNFAMTVVSPSYNNERSSSGKLVFQQNANGTDLSQMLYAESTNGEKLFHSKK